MFESESGFKDILTGAYLKLGTANLYAGDMKYGYLDELAGLYCDYPGYNTNSVYNQAIVFDYTNQFLSKKDNLYLEMYNVVAMLLFHTRLHTIKNRHRFCLLIRW